MSRAAAAVFGAAILGAVIGVSTAPIVRGGEQRLIPFPTSAIGITHELIGPLGRPMGDVFWVTIVPRDLSPKGHFDSRLSVTAIDGHPLREPVDVWAELGGHHKTLEQLKPGEAIEARVYQWAGMTGIPAQLLRERPVQAASHSFSTWLVLIDTRSPAGQPAVNRPQAPRKGVP